MNRLGRWVDDHPYVVVPVLGLALWALSGRVLVNASRRGILFTVESPLLYHAGTLSFDAFEFGPVRRGLAGAVAHLLSADRLVATVRFHVLFAALLAGLVAWWLWRERRSLAERVLAALLVAVLALRWAEDAGRSDIAIAALLAAATLAALRRSPALACTAVAVGLGLHETSFIFGLPLLAGLALDRSRWRTWPPRSIGVGLGVIAVATLVYLALPALPHADSRSMVEAVRGQLPRHKYVDWAIYFAVSGARGVRTSVCQNAHDPAYWLHQACGLVLVAAFVELLRTPAGPSRRISWLVSLPPIAFLAVVANDVSRWAVLASFNVWLLAAIAACERPDARPPARMPLRLVLALALVPLTHPRVWPIADPIFAPMPVVEHAWTALGGAPALRFADALERCDPRWREALGDPMPPR